mgnify:CR=1 FL=1
MSKLNLVIAFHQENDNDYIISDIFKSALQDEKFYFQINEILDFALERYQKYYQNKYKDTNLVYIKNTLMKKFVIY